MELTELKQLVNKYADFIFRIGIFLTILSTLFLFTNLTTDFYEPAKFLVLLFVTGIMLIILTLKFSLAGKVTLVRTPLDIPFLLLLAVAVVSSVMSTSPYVSFLGPSPRVHGGLVSIAVYIVFYFMLVNFLKSKKDINIILYFLISSGVILSFLTLLTFWGIKILPASWTNTQNFTPTGSSFSTAAVLTLTLPILIINSLKVKNIVWKLINCLILALFGTTILLTGSLAVWVVSSLVALFSYYIYNPIQDITHLTYEKITNLAIAVVPILIVLAVGIFAFVSIPGINPDPDLIGTNLIGVKNPLYTLERSYPREVQVPFITSWKVSVSSFRDSPFWGTGPATYIFDFTNYKPLDFNQSKFWNIRFDLAYNEYLQFLAQVGGIGLLALLSISAMFISSAILALRSKDNLKSALAISGMAFFAIFALHGSTLVVWVIGLIFLSLFFGLHMSEGNVERQSTSNIGQFILRLATSPQASLEEVKIEALPSIALIVAFALVLFVFFFAGKLTLADYHHRLALNAVSQNNIVSSYNELIAAEKLNSVSDLYRTDLAQVNLALANAIVLSKAPNEQNPQGTLTDQDRQNIQTLLQQTVSEGRVAVTLSPRSAVNWEILAVLYRQIAGVANNALLFSLDSYGRAIFQDPLNPVLRLSVGGVYYAVGNYDLAIRFFTDAINLKPDFANGYYNLSVALREKGDLNASLQAAEKVVTLVDANSQDYKVATDYLNDLKNRISPPTPEQPPAAETSGAIEGKNLPNINLEKPANIATPSAVKKPNSTPEPTATP